MSNAGFLHTLIQARDAGVGLWAEDGELIVTHESMVPVGLEIAIDSLRPGLIEILTWDRGIAEGIVLDGLAQLEEFYVLSDQPETLGQKLDALQAPNAQISAAFAACDMHGLRVTVFMWVQAGRNAYEDWTEGVGIT